MPTHDIIDNRKEILVDHINRILSSTEAARFAVGYFFLSGLTSIAEREHTISLTQGQRYVLREMRVLFGSADEDMKAQINILEKAFRGPMTTAITRELNRIRRNGITSENLLSSLAAIYHQHNMRDWLDRRSLQLEDQPIPRIICSEGLS